MAGGGLGEGQLCEPSEHHYLRLRRTESHCKSVRCKAKKSGSIPLSGIESPYEEARKIQKVPTELPTKVKVTPLVWLANQSARAGVCRLMCPKDGASACAALARAGAGARVLSWYCCRAGVLLGVASENGK